MSGGLAKLAITSQNTFTKIKGHVAGAMSNTKFMSHSVDELREKLKRVNEVRFGTVMKSEFNTATRAAKNLEAQINRMDGTRSRGGILGKAARYIGPFAIAAGLMSFGTSSVKAAMNFEATKKSFQVLTGSQTVGTDLSGDLRQLKQNTIMGPAVYANAQKMLGFGIAANKVVPDLKMLGDVSMGDAAKLGRLTLAFSEVEAAGKLNGRRFLQFINAGFNPLQEMSRTTGLSMEKLADKMKDGKISAKMLEDAFKSATSTGGRFNNMMNVMGETTQGKMKKLEGQWANFKINAGEVLLPLASGFMELASSALQAFHIQKTIPETLLGEKLEINSLVASITKLNVGNDLRTRLLDTLKTKYPDIFANINTETVKNAELLKMLNDVNLAYDKRIGLASKSLIADDAERDINDKLSLASRAATQAAYDEQNPNGSYLDKFKYLGMMDHAKIAWKGFSDGTVDGLKSFVVSTQKEVEGLYKVKSKALNEKAGMENRNLLSDAQGALHKGSFSGITKNSFRDLIVDTMHKMQSGTATADDYEKIRSYMSASQIKGKGGKETSVTSDEAGSKSVAAGITGGGPRVININFKNMVEKLDIHSSGVDAGLADMENKLEEHFLRILNSGASVQGN